MKKILVLLAMTVSLMASSQGIKISALPTSTTPCDTCYVPVVKGTATVKTQGKYLHDAWSKTGNSGTSAGTNFVGTTDNVRFDIRTNNTIRASILGSGNVGIGQTNPAKLLDVNGDALINGITTGRGTGNNATNTTFGNGAGPTGGASNVYVGAGAGAAEPSSYNVAVGWNSMLLHVNPGGGSNVAVGQQAMKTVSTGNCTAIGPAAAFAGGHYGGVFMGYLAGFTATTDNAVGTDGTTAIGDHAAYNLGLATGSNSRNNTFIGAYSGGSVTTGYGNTGIGVSTTGNYGSLNSLTGSRNSSLGLSAGANLSTGSDNLFLGYNSGSAVTTGQYNVIIGGNTGSTIATVNNQILISDGQGNLRVSVDNSGNVKIHAILEYADNAAALSGGLVAGQMYRTGDDLKIVH